MKCPKGWGFQGHRMGGGWVALTLESSSLSLANAICLFLPHGQVFLHSCLASCPGSFQISHLLLQVTDASLRGAELLSAHTHLGR